MTDWTPKENFMAVLGGEIPQSVPRYNMGMKTMNGRETTRGVGPSILRKMDSHMSPKGGKDIWGVSYVANEETGFASIPEPNNFILDDITKWRDIVKAPEIDLDIDWEAMAKKDMEDAEIDRNVTAVYSSAMLMPFQQLVAFMGFSEGLCALYEEPEEVKALLNYMTDFYVPIIEKTIEYYKPDCYYMLDDTASRYSTFFSKEIYQDIFRPIYDRLAAPANERGLPIGFHNCGRCETFLDEMVGFGVKWWDPAQHDNDLLGIKEKYGRDLVITGGWEVQLMPSWPDVSDDEVRQTVYDTVDKLAPGGGYMFIGGILVRPGDEKAAHLHKLVQETASEYCDHYYEKH